MHTDPKNGDGRDVVSKPQVDAEAFMKHFFAQLRQNVPGLAAMALQRAPTDAQLAAIDHFNAAGAGLAVRSFIPVLAYLPARDEDGNLHVDVPEGAVTARVYSRKGVTDRRVDPCKPLVVHSDSGWIARIEFLNGKGAAIAATGSEPPPAQQAY